MIRKRLEILKNDTWTELELYYGEGLRYNSIINKMATTDDRSLSHSNTFEIPWTKQNIEALSLNVFSPIQLANALNEKYNAKYYVEDQLLQEGYVVINNMNGGIPSLNFIDEALSLVEKWGDTTYKEFLEDDTILLNVDSAYTDAIDDMRSYSTSKSEVLDVLSNVSGENFPIAYFPNTINCIGDKFQVYSDDARLDDYFNPYQCRPIFNAMAFLNMITQAYGYTLVKHNSIDWDKVEVTCITANGLSQGEIDDGTTDGAYPTVEFIAAHYISVSGSLWSTQAGMVFPSSVGITPDSLTNFPTNPTGLSTPAATWFTNRRIFAPDLSGGNSGTIRFYAEHESLTPGTALYTIWSHATNANEYVIEATTINEDNSTTSIIDVSIEKSQFDTIPTNGGEVIGIYVLRSNTATEQSTPMYNMFVEEEVLAAGVVTYDDHGQIEQSEVDLTYAAPRKTLKEILNGILQKFGGLIDIDHKTKEVEIFSYRQYGSKRYSNQFRNWSDYFQQYDSPNWNTNYGNRYAVKNKIGLNNPYLGNSVERYLGNQVAQSKLKEFATDYNTQFSDITKLVIVNYTNNPYDEYSIGGASMLEFSSNLSGNFTQASYDQDTSTVTTQGTITGIPNIVNVNYSTLEEGQDDWYTLIDESLRCKPTFLLPQREIRNLNLKDPVYISHLGGYYIIEEISEYQDEITPVEVSLIKLPNDWGSPAENPDPNIVFNVTVTPPGTGSILWTAQAQYSFNGFADGEPTSANWYLIGKDEFGVPNGNDLGPFSVNVNLSAYTYAFPIDQSENGIYETYLVTNDGTESTHIDINIGEPEITEYITISKTNGIGDVINSIAEYSVDEYVGFTPTSATHYLQQIDPTTQSPIGTAISISTSTSIGNYSRGLSIGTWRIYVEATNGTNTYQSNSLNWTRLI